MQQEFNSIDEILIRWKPMTHNRYIIHVPLADLNTDSFVVPDIVSLLVTRLREFYRFIGVEDQNLTVKYIRHRAIVSGILFLSPCPRVSIDYSDRTKVVVDVRNVNIEPLFDREDINPQGN